jgi:hypothetical protein
VWHVAEKDSQWFSPSESPFMINCRVDNLGEMLEQLRAGGVEVGRVPRRGRCGDSRGLGESWGWPRAGPPQWLRKRSASIAAMQPLPAAVTAWR